jgi:hypothetical protein
MSCQHYKDQPGSALILYKKESEFREYDTHTLCEHGEVFVNVRVADAYSYHKQLTLT